MKGGAAPSWPRVMCGQAREAAREAVDRGSVGRLLSSEITRPGCRPRMVVGKATRYMTLHGESYSGPAESKTLLHAWTLYAREPGDLGGFRQPVGRRSGWGRSVAEIPTCTPSRVRHQHNTEEGAEQCWISLKGGQVRS